MLSPLVLPLARLVVLLFERLAVLPLERPPAVKLLFERPVVEDVVPRLVVEDVVPRLVVEEVPPPRLMVEDVVLVALCRESDEPGEVLPWVRARRLMVVLGVLPLDWPGCLLLCPDWPEVTLATPAVNIR